MCYCNIIAHAILKYVRHMGAFLVSVLLLIWASLVFAYAGKTGLLIFLGWIISLCGLGLTFTVGLSACLSDGPHNNTPAWAILLMMSGPIAVFYISYLLLFKSKYTVKKMLIMGIPILICTVDLLVTLFVSIKR